MLDQADAKRWVETAREQGADRILVAYDDVDMECPEYPRYLRPGEALERAEVEMGLSIDDDDAADMQYELGVFHLGSKVYENLLSPACGHLLRVSQQIGDLLTDAAEE